MRLERHILRELLVNFAFALAVIYFVVAIGVVIQLFSSRDLPLGSSIALAPIALLMRSDLLTPLAFLAAVLFTYGRLSAESEYVATQACGVHPARVLGPIVLVGLLLSSAQIFILSYAVPELWFQRNQIIDFIGVQALNQFEPGRNEFEAKQIGFFMSWNRRDGMAFEDVVLDYRGRPQDGGGARGAQTRPETRPQGSMTKGVASRVELAIEPQKVRFIIKGFRTADKRGGVDLGEFSLVFDKNLMGESVDFRSRPEFLSTEVLIESALRADRRAASGGGGAMHADPRFVELDKKLARRFWYETHRRAAWSFAGLLFGLLGAPIAIWLRRGTRLSAIVTAIAILFLLYFPLAKLGDALGDNMSIPVWARAWLASAVAFSLGAAFYVKLVRR